MQTFLPYDDFKKSVSVLDNKRLGKQRVEAMQILNTFNKISGGWVNHPAVNMWRGYEQALIYYMNVCIEEWISRGFNNSMSILYIDDINTIEYPWWFGDERLHSSHRSNLLRKDPIWYSKFGWVEPNNLPYFWPTKEKTCHI